jgi:pilus assembly protein CpaF
VAVAGVTGSGKTTVLRLLAEMIPDDERIIIIQQDQELQRLARKYVVTLEERPASREGQGQVTTRDLLQNAVRMRPDRIVLAEVTGSEALDLMQIMHTSYSGLTSINANGPRDALAQLETLITTANPSAPLLYARQQVALALDLIVHQTRLRDGRRKVIKVTEVQGMQGDAVVLQDIFEFRETGLAEGKVSGYFTATGHIPAFLDRIQAAGVDLPVDFFRPG